MPAVLSRRLSRTTLGALIALAFSLSVGEHVAMAGSTMFCEQRVLRDYRSPLRRMPSLPAIPTSGQLPFAPPGMSLVVLDDGLRVGKGLIGFRFFDEAVDVRRRLNWTIESILRPINASGSLRGRPRSKIVHYGAGLVRDFPGLRFSVSGRPAFYRVDLVFRNRGGAVLGRFGAYFRSVRSQLISRITLSESEVAPGKTLFARVENLGTEAVLPQSSFRIERAEGAGWSEIAGVHVPGIKPSIRTVLFGGLAGPCVSYALPSDLPPGIYRVSNRISGLQDGSRRTLSARFRVSL